MISRQQLDRLVLRITGKDIRLVGFWNPLPGLEEFRAEYAKELGVSAAQLMRCNDIVDVLDLAGTGRTSRPPDTEHPLLF
jgi:hypothetical protein